MDSCCSVVTLVMNVSNIFQCSNERWSKVDVDIKMEYSVMDNSLYEMNAWHYSIPEALNFVKR